MDAAYREPNGRISRAIEPVDKLALETRAQRLGLTVIEAKDQLAATFIGRLHMQYKAWELRAASDVRAPIDSLSHRQYTAAVRYRDLHNDFAKVIQSPEAYYDGKSRGEGDDVAHAEWAERIKVKYRAAREAIAIAQGQHRAENLWAAIDYCIIRDEDHPNMIPALKTLCNSLARHWGLD